MANLAWYPVPSFVDVRAGHIYIIRNIRRYLKDAIGVTLEAEGFGGIDAELTGNNLVLSVSGTLSDSPYVVLKASRDGEVARELFDVRLISPVDVDKFVTSGEITSFITEDDLDYPVTDGDISGFVTESEISNFISESDIEYPVTDGDIANFATNGDIAKFISANDVDYPVTDGDIANFISANDVNYPVTDGDIAGFISENDIAFPVTDDGDILSKFIHQC